MDKTLQYHAGVGTKAIVACCELELGENTRKVETCIILVVPLVWQGERYKLFYFASSRHQYP